MNKARGRASDGNDFADHSDFAPHRSTADMALQHRGGYYPSGGLGLVVIVLLVLILLGRV